MPHVAKKKAVARIGDRICTDLRSNGMERMFFAFSGLVSVIFVLLQSEKNKEEKNARNAINLIHCRYTSK
jgi:hypothetical protein